MKFDVKKHTLKKHVEKIHKIVLEEILEKLCITFRNYKSFFLKIFDEIFIEIFNYDFFIKKNYSFTFFFMNFKNKLRKNLIKLQKIS